MSVSVPAARSPAGTVDDPASAAMRILVAGVGYDHLRDMSAGPILVQELRGVRWPPGVDVEDLSAGAVHVTHVLQSREPYQGAVLIGAVQRGDPPGTVRVSRFVRGAATPEEVQVRVTEAVTGVVSLDTLLTVLDHFGALPDDVRVIEVEPRDTAWGDELSPLVRHALADATVAVRSAVAELGR
ncbi:MAG: hypothetical protein A2V85_12295 [Chloroflexi bacterium RBG_16_72_14]|nr:MAG: hypothetical protein A2V85_12295 [Chloroflexi bacterium RBG_16_72_14]